MEKNCREEPRLKRSTSLEEEPPRGTKRFKVRITKILNLLKSTKNILSEGVIIKKRTRKNSESTQNSKGQKPIETQDHEEPSAEEPRFKRRNSILARTRNTERNLRLRRGTRHSLGCYYRKNSGSENERSTETK